MGEQVTGGGDAPPEPFVPLAGLRLGAVRYLEPDHEVSGDGGLEQRQFARSGIIRIEHRFFVVGGPGGEQGHVAELDVPERVGNEGGELRWAGAATDEVHRVDEEPEVRPPDRFDDSTTVGRSGGMSPGLVSMVVSIPASTTISTSVPNRSMLRLRSGSPREGVDPSYAELGHDGDVGGDAATVVGPTRNPSPSEMDTSQSCMAASISRRSARSSLNENGG